VGKVETIKMQINNNPGTVILSLIAAVSSIAANGAGTP